MRRFYIPKLANYCDGSQNASQPMPSDCYLPVYDCQQPVLGDLSRIAQTLGYGGAYHAGIIVYGVVGSNSELDRIFI